jgi:hypothetical protein
VANSNRLERLVNELADELGRERKEDRERLAAWYQGLLENERRKGERTVSLTEMLRSAHGLGQGDDDPPAA